MSNLASLILTAIQVAPQAITEIIALYNAVKGDISETDQQTIDNELAAAQQADATATADADAALGAASTR